MVFVAAVLVARARWPTNRTGLLMIKVGFALCAGGIQLARQPLIIIRLVTATPLARRFLMPSTSPR